MTVPADLRPAGKAEPLATLLADLPGLAGRLEAACSADAVQVLEGIEHAGFLLRLCRAHVAAVDDVLVPALADVGPLPPDLAALAAEHRRLGADVLAAGTALAAVRLDPCCPARRRAAADTLYALHAQLAAHLPRESRALAAYAAEVLSVTQRQVLAARAAGALPVRDRRRLRWALLAGGGHARPATVDGAKVPRWRGGLTAEPAAGRRLPPVKPRPSPCTPPLGC